MDTERKFQASRFAEMAWSRHPDVLMARSPALDATMSRVMLISPSNTDELLTCLEVSAFLLLAEARYHAWYSSAVLYSSIKVTYV